MKGSTLRPARIVVATAAFGLITALFVSAGMAVPRVAGWLARIQLLPAAMAFGMAVFVGWLIVTLIFGRVYCSTVCPMGYFQDLCARLVRLRAKDRARRAYHYTAPSTRTRVSLLVLTALSLVLGVGIVPMLLDPYSAYGRMMLSLAKPAWAFVTSQPVQAAAGSVAGLAVASLTAFAVAWAAVRNGRTVCNTVCPVGTTLGFVSRYSIFHIDINTDRCIQCRKCEHACKARCIDLQSHTVDTSRCVVCFDCLTDCPNDAIHYTPSSHRLSLPMMQRIQGVRRRPEPTAASGPRPIDRRKFIATGMIVAAAPLLLRADKGARAVALAAGKREPRPSLAVMPPGAADRTFFLQRCTACGLCMSHCPTGVIRPAAMDYATPQGMLHPVMRFDTARCDYECTRCNNLCPTGALSPLTLREKQHTAIGRAMTLPLNCIHCGECAAACPTHAITMRRLTDADFEENPVVNPDVCIGCGACQSVCPAYPFKAIYVDGLADLK